jgi:hypothetical protein
MKSPEMTLLQYGCRPLDALGVTCQDLDILAELGVQWTLDSEPLPAWCLDDDSAFLIACGIALAPATEELR